MEAEKKCVVQGCKLARYFGDKSLFCGKHSEEWARSGEFKRGLHVAVTTNGARLRVVVVDFIRRTEAEERNEREQTQNSNR